MGKCVMLAGFRQREPNPGHAGQQAGKRMLVWNREDTRELPGEGTACGAVKEAASGVAATITSGTAHHSSPDDDEGAHDVD